MGILDGNLRYEHVSERVTSKVWPLSSINLRSLEFLALNFCSLTDCQKLWYNCSLFVNTTFKLINISYAICVLTAKSQFFDRNLVNTDNFTMDSNYFYQFEVQK